MRAKKVVISALVIILFLLGVSSFKIVDEYKLHNMVSYEGNKYALYLKVKEHKLLSNEMIVYPENDVNRFFYVKKEKKDTYKDGYVYRLIEPLLYERILGIQNQDFKNFKYAVMVSNNNDGNLSVSDYDYKEQPELEDFFNKEKKALVTIKVFVNYGDKLDKLQTANEIGDFINKIMKNKLSNRDVKISFQFYLVTSKQYVKINPEKYKFKYKNEIIKDLTIKNIASIECKGQKDYKDKVKITH
ncbi:MULTISPECIES: hypothetical protein [Clostridium]|uniref:hypothetical protein n=1 Tax=Clostridium TaxID=1485 RepID=UPI000826D4A2|nr:MULTISPECIES: hypothetical protein [Clostridium]PJI09602.1 hypothetical protein CUB90_17770 [Clostridium sp. CT7]